MDNEEFRQWGHKLVDWVAEYIQNVGDYPVQPSLEPGDVKRQLPAEAPPQGEPMQSIFQDFQKMRLFDMMKYKCLNDCC